jgi:hypothetical protein
MKPLRSKRVIEEKRIIVRSSTVAIIFLVSWYHNTCVSYCVIAIRFPASTMSWIFDSYKR